MSDFNANTSEKLATAQEIEKYFKNLANKAASNGGKRNFTRTFTSNSNLLNLTKQDNLGVALIHLIPDANRNYVRQVQYMYELYVKEPQYDRDTGAPKLDQNGAQIVWNRTKYVLNPVNYNNASLTPSQVQLCSEVNDLAKEFADLAKTCQKVEEIMGIKYRKEIALFYGYLNSLIIGSKIKESGGVKVFRHNSANFVKNFVEATNAKTLSKGSVMWMSEWFSRNIGRNDKITSIQTSLSTGYVTSFAFDQSERGVEITKEDMDLASDLNKEFIDVTVFPDKDYEAYKVLLKNNIELAKQVVASMANQVTAPAAASVVQAPVAAVNAAVQVGVPTGSGVPPTFQSQQMSNVQQSPVPTEGLGKLPF